MQACQAQLAGLGGLCCAGLPQQPACMNTSCVEMLGCINQAGAGLDVPVLKMQQSTQRACALARALVVSGEVYVTGHRCTGMRRHTISAEMWHRPCGWTQHVVVDDPTSSPS